MATTTSTSSISGLASGLDTDSIITKLMAIESVPQTQLQTKLTAADNKKTAYQAINTSIASVLTAAKALTSADTWATAKATSSNSTVSATAGTGATTGTLSFTVSQLATAHSTVSDSVYTDKTSDTGLGTTLTLTTAAGTTKNITLDTTGDGTTSLTEAVAAINAAGAGVKASAVNTGSGYKLQLTATTTGASAAFTTAFSGTSASTFNVATQGQDAKLTVGSTNSYTVTSASNTFTDVMAGTTFTVSKAGESATLTVASDPDAVSDAVQNLVTSVSNALALIKTDTAYADPTDTTTSNAVLAGDSTLRALKQSLLSAISSALPAKSGTTSGATYGLEVASDGTITYDADTFTAALKANPDAVQKAFQGALDVGPDNVKNTMDDVVTTDGLAARLQKIALVATDSVNGSLTTLTNGQSTRAQDLTSQIADWTTRLAQRKTTLQAKYTAMETALSTLSTKASWLTSQIDSMSSDS